MELLVEHTINFESLQFLELLCAQQNLNECALIRDRFTDSGILL